MRPCCKDTRHIESTFPPQVSYKLNWPQLLYKLTSELETISAPCTQLCYLCSPPPVFSLPFISWCSTTSCGLWCCVLRPHLASNSACGNPFSIALHQFSLVWRRTISWFPPKRPLRFGLTFVQILIWQSVCCVVLREASGPQFLGWHRKDHWPKGQASV